MDKDEMRRKIRSIEQMTESEKRRRMAEIEFGFVKRRAIKSRKAQKAKP